MKIGFMKDVLLTNAKKMYLLDCQAAGWTRKALRGRRDVLAAFVTFVGQITVQELTPDHVRLSIANLAELSGRYGTIRLSVLAKHYAVIRA